MLSGDARPSPQVGHHDNPLGDEAEPQGIDKWLLRGMAGKRARERLSALEVENVFKIAAADSLVRGFLEGEGWKPQGKDEEMEMDAYRNTKTGRRVFVEDISDGFPVTFLMGELSLEEFSDMARDLTPGIGLLEVDSSWEGEATTIVVAMTKGQVREMFGRRTGMRELSVTGREEVTRAPP